MDFAINVILPGAQAFIMFSLGLSLTVLDFQRVFTAGKAVVIGIFAQLLVLPLVAYAIIIAFGLPPVLAAGVMLLSFCPGGVSSNVISKLSRGDLALAVSLTAVTSLLAFITVPPLATFAVLHFMGETAPDFSITELGLFTFMLTTVPVLTGVFIRHVLPEFSKRVEGFLGKLAVALWVILVAFIFYGVRDLIVEWMSVLGPSLMALPICLMILSGLFARSLGVSVRQSKTVSIETSVQNSPLGIALAGVIMGTTTGMSELALPSAIYSVTMYLVTVPAIFIFRRIGNTHTATTETLTSTEIRSA